MKVKSLSHVLLFATPWTAARQASLSFTVPWSLPKFMSVESVMLSTYETEVAQSCPTLRDPIDASPPGSPVSGILQARTLEWVAISFSNA